MSKLSWFGWFGAMWGALGHFLCEQIFGKWKLSQNLTFLPIFHFPEICSHKSCPSAPHNAPNHPNQKNFVIYAFRRFQIRANRFSSPSGGGATLVWSSAIFWNFGWNRPSTLPNLTFFRFFDLRVPPGSEKSRFRPKIMKNRSVLFFCMVWRKFPEGRFFALFPG